MATVKLGGYLFAIKGGIKQFWVQRQTQPYRLQGVQSRDDDASVNRYRFPSFPLGIGFQEIHRESGYGVGGLLDSTSITNFPGVFPAGLHELQTHAAPADHLKRAQNFKGDLWGLFEEDYAAGATTDLVSRKFGATSDDQTGGGTLESGSGVLVGARGFDMVVHKSSLFAAACDSGGTEVVYTVDNSADGVTWNDVSGTGFPDNAGTNRYITTTTTRRNNFDDDEARLLPYGNVLLMALYRDPTATDGDGQIAVYSTTDSGTNWALDVTIPSGDGPKAFVDWVDLDGARSPVLITAEGIYSINTTLNTYELIQELDGDPANGRWARVSNLGDLYVGLGTGKVLVISISDTGYKSSFISGPPGSGLVTARQGHVTYMLPVDEYMLVAYGGHAANKYASIFMIDTQVVLKDPETGKQYNPWHHVYQHGTANLDIVALAYSTEDDATPRLHFAVEGAAASLCYHIEEPFTHPTQRTTKKYQASSIIRIGEDDMGDPHTASMVLFSQVFAANLSAAITGEYVSHQYGIDGAVDTTTTLGSYLSGDVDLSFFATGSITVFADAGVGLVTVTSAAHGLVEGDSVTISGTTNYNGTFTIRDVATDTFAIRDTWVADDATGTWHCYKGISAKTISQRLTLIRDATDNTDYVHLKEVEYQSQNVYLKKKAWQFTIDVVGSPVTPVANTNKSETIKANIEALAESGILVPFEYSETEGVKYVRVPNNQGPGFDLELHNSDNLNRGYVSGPITIIVEEGS